MNFHRKAPLLIALIWPLMLAAPSTRTFSADCEPSTVQPVANGANWTATKVPGLEAWLGGKWEFPDLQVVRRDGTIETLKRRSICFDAIRFDLDRFRLNLVEVPSLVELADRVRGTANRGKEGKFELRRPSIRSAFAIVSETNNAVAITNAGWATGFDRPAPEGGLKIGGEVYAELVEYSELSAILCLNDATQATNTPLPIVFSYDPKTWSADKAARIEKCNDYVQVGPRLIEVSNEELLEGRLGECLKDEGPKAGICSRSALVEPGRLSLFALDAENDSAPLRPLAAYLIVTTNETNLYDAQNMLLSKEFYAGRVSNWAINLSGRDLSGMIVDADLSATSGNIDAPLSSGLVLLGLE